MVGRLAMSPWFMKTVTPLVNEERKEVIRSIPQRQSTFKTVFGARSSVCSSFDFCPVMHNVFLSMQRSNKAVNFVPRMRGKARFTTTSFQEQDLLFKIH